MDGEHEVPGRLRLLDQRNVQLQAPRKEHVVIPGAGHRSLFQRPGPPRRAALGQRVVSGSG
ncbi:hypothetical protein [Micromonospora haikouensis]|uniref:hypothetical protein n=1 Tax=Micromonospora haikouensis TaxID=686309 RepID=UPI00159F0DA2|nr:hypothetical protein [Micromonospora haikouensis]